MTAAIEQFLYREARLPNAGRFDDWLALFTADATYWVPLEANQKDPLVPLSRRHAASQTMVSAPSSGVRRISCVTRLKVGSLLALGTAPALPPPGPAAPERFRQ